MAPTLLLFTTTRCATSQPRRELELQCDPLVVSLTHFSKPQLTACACTYAAMLEIALPISPKTRTASSPLWAPLMNLNEPENEEVASDERFSSCNEHVKESAKGVGRDGCGC